MSSENTHKVADLIASGKLCIGDGYRAKNSELGSDGIPFARAGDINDGFHFKSGDHLPEGDAWKAGNKLSQVGDVVFTSRGTVGRFGYVTDSIQKFVYSPQLCFWRSLDRNAIDPRFLFYWVQSKEFYQQYKSVSQKTNMAEYVSLSDQRSMEITLPFSGQQKAIAHILGTLDDKIELNRKTNETLEAMAKALFKSWFVDFDPVRAKAEGRPTGLPDEISDLFPDSFEDLELGEIPKGWTIQSAGKQYEVSIGKTPPRKEPQWFSTSNDDMPWLSIRDLGEVGVYADRTSERLTREAIEKFNVKIVPPDTAVLSFKLTIGRVAITWGEMLTNEAIAHFLPLTNGVGSEYTYCLLSQYDYHSLGSTSSIATAVNSQILRDMPLVVPPGTIARAFCDATASIFSSLKCAQQETHCLSDFRDTLLPKLISGEIRIPDAEKMRENFL